MMTKKKAVTKHPTTASTEVSRRDIIDMDRNVEFCLKKIPISQARIERIKDELRTWLDKNPTAKAISEFYYLMGVSHKTYYRLLDRDEELKELHEITMRRMGNKLWGNAVENKANWNAVKFMIHHYAPEFKEAREYEANLNKKDEVEATKFVIEMGTFPNSPIVPEKRKDIDVKPNV